MINKLTDFKKVGDSEFVWIFVRGDYSTFISRFLKLFFCKGKPHSSSI